MTPLEYLESLIAGMKMGSEIPVQLSELEFLKKLIQMEKQVEFLETLVQTENKNG